MKTPPACFEKEQLFAYSAHMLDRAEEGRVRTHLDSCPACRRIVADFQKLDRVLEEWKPVEPSPWFDARARARIASSAELRSRFPLSGFRWKVLAGMAAVAVLVVITSVIALRPSHPSRSFRSGHSGMIAQAKPTPKTTVMKANKIAPPPPSVAPADTTTVAQSQPANEEINLYKNLKVLEDYDMLANFDVLSELPQAGDRTGD